MGSENSNSYWEAELPPNHDRVGIENFIRAKYEDKRWVSKDGKPRSPVREQVEQPSAQLQRPVERSGYGYNRNLKKFAEDRKKYRPRSTNNSIPAARIGLLVPPRDLNLEEILRGNDEPSRNASTRNEINEQCHKKFGSCYSIRRIVW